MDRKQVEPERLFSIHETADLLSLSRWTIRRWAQERRIVSHKLGSRILIPESEIVRLMTASRRPVREELAIA
jgi:excisionase family DNA binding protein